MVAVNVVATGGIAVTESPFGAPMTPTAMPGIAVTILDAGGMPVQFVDEFGAVASPMQWSDGDDVEFSDGSAVQWSS